VGQQLLRLVVDQQDVQLAGVCGGHEHSFVEKEPNSKNQEPNEILKTNSEIPNLSRICLMFGHLHLFGSWFLEFGSLAPSSVKPHAHQRQQLVGVDRLG